MAQFIEFVKGTRLDGLPDDAAHEAQSLTHLLTQGVLDALLALAMYEQASATYRGDRNSWERDRALEQQREAELAAEDPRDWGAPDWFEWHTRISAQARGDVVRQKWAAGELPSQLSHRLPFLYAELLVTSLAQVGRTLSKLARYDLDAATPEVAAARDDFEAKLPALKAVRDSVEHAEDRMRGRGKSGQPLTLAPVTNTAIHAPGGGALIAGMLNNNSLGWTTEDGTYREVEVSDATIEIARAAVQRALNALPWKQHGYPSYVPY
jgi:hypothetical protein